jgi:diguanylate cyclase (GGDEF)-like protein
MFNGSLLAHSLAAGLLAIAILAVGLRLRSLSRRANSVDHRHRTFVAEAEQSGAMRLKIEAQLLDKQQRLDRLAHHDQLTGLPNRLYLAAHLPEALAAAKRTGTPLAVLFLDLDRFKHINDTRGHETGDKLLQAVAERIREAVRTDDVVVRMGGDEFIVVLGTVKNSEQVNETAARINSALATPVVIDGRPLVTTASIGVSLYPRDGQDADALLRHSDTAMYQAKDRGRNNFQVFSPAMDRKLKERVAIESSLRAAMAGGQLALHYQPLIDVNTRRVVALEALLRWKHPSEGYIQPTRFIPVAEECGLIVPIGQFALERAISDLAAWRAAGLTPVPVALNVSAGQLRRGNLRSAIASALDAHGLSPSLLQIELTEGAMFEQLEGRQGDSNEDVINDLRALGVRVAIDDFGTGYSSLAYLKRWRVDYLKVDRSFVRDLVTDPSDLAIVGAILAMARHMHIDVIAEGVEGFPQLEMLRKLGCRYAQGYLFAEPAPAADCERFLRARPVSVADIDLGEDVLVGATDQVA